MCMYVHTLHLMSHHMHPMPLTMHPMPLCHTPCTLCHTPCTLFHTPCTLCHTPCTLFHTPCTLFHIPCTLFHSVCTIFHALCNPYMVDFHAPAPDGVRCTGCRGKCRSVVVHNGDSATHKAPGQTQRGRCEPTEIRQCRHAAEALHRRHLDKALTVQRLRDSIYARACLSIARLDLRKRM